MPRALVPPIRCLVAPLPGARLPRFRRCAAGDETRRGGPDRHPADQARGPGPGGGEGRAAHQESVRQPVGAVQPRRPAALRRTEPGHRHAGRDAGSVRSRAGRRLSAVHLRDGDRRDRGTADLGGAGAVAPALSAGGVGAAGVVGNRQGSLAGAGRVPAPGHGPGRLGARADRMRAVRHPRSACRLPRRVRRTALSGLPRRRVGRHGQAGPGDDPADGGARRRGLDRGRGRAGHRPAGGVRAGGGAAAVAPRAWAAVAARWWIAGAGVPIDSPLSDPSTAIKGTQPANGLPVGEFS